ncbi:MAG: ribosomal protein L7AE [Bacillota bacterium]|nr:MAG: ribosomal protein L7AE [Bacillota bacterium]MBS3950171.1 ribosomal L7Ae/L30e/S12e/Gadd45 family protein [Peptococcaceae bacterium]
MNDKFYGMLGLAQRARAVISGTVACEQALKKGKADLIVLADDAAAEVREEYMFLCTKYKIPLLTVPSKAMLGSAIGKSPRVAVVIIEQNFGRRLKELCTR